MIFARFLAVFLLLAATIAIAADKPSSSDSTHSAQYSNVAPAPPQAPAITEPAVNSASGQPFWLYRVEPVIATTQSVGSEGIPSPRLKARSPAGLGGNVCYFMRTYRIRPTERVREGGTVSRGYSECEMASNYQIRSTEAHEKEPAKLK